jgi:acetylornithine deacetylase/succinyl-diaminopimelate desuccinylase-like protein
MLVRFLRMKNLFLLSTILLLTHAAGSRAMSAPIESRQANLVATVRYLSEEIGIRSFRDLSRLNKTADYIEASFKTSGCVVSRQAFTYEGRTYYNVIGEVKGTNPAKQEILIIGAHYDTAITTPGADDNASGVAGLLELARLMGQAPAERTIRFVAFSLEEPPVFGTEEMGSYFYARQAAQEAVRVHCMIALEMIGYFCDEKGCQEYPPGVGWLFPDKGNFISFVGNLSS